ncbi:hypothetical protein [uncultured Dysgonomonas sp.]|uniref:Uncharacterized protein n=1 Tax=uncultured Dysgonomonas sp. TaxID=206096 RepID=A0A212K548_9BACT|nr:hypothetical protein [uncultured Dysgonomonas sp.]SBW06870.1 conserved hypothetical protein [uncultured Dysgonomonas sp.]
MKLLKILIFIFIPFLLFSCKEDIMKDIEDGSWNNERSIVSISFEHQVGTATIKRDKNNDGIVSFMFNESAGNKSSVKIKDIELSYGATADTHPGDILNFDNATNSAQITVTAESGQKRTWEITYIPFSDELIGTWKITTLSVYGGAWPEYGGAGYYNDIAERSWNWEYGGSGPVAEYDNTLTFTLEGITEAGDTYGKLINDAGADGKYANFIFIDDPDGARTPIDINYNYRKIPKGESTWKRNSQQGTITFTAADNSTATGRFVGSGQEVLDDYGNSMTVTDKAFTFEYQPTYIWIDIYKDRERLVENLKRFWIQVKKID